MSNPTHWNLKMSAEQTMNLENVILVELSAFSHIPFRVKLRA